MESNSIKDDLNRNVWCLMGLPIDAISMEQALAVIDDSIAKRKKVFLTTPNLNFVIGCQEDSQFRDSVIHSDLVVADGMPLIWVAKLLGIPIRERVSGSNLVERLFDQKNSIEKYKIFYFGGQDDVADRANENTEKKSEAAVGVGAISPGFVSVDVMSKPEYIQKINESDADLLVVALGAKKGQDWIVKNLPDLTVPVVSHLGAVVNFVAGTVSRSPGWMQKTGLEWLWRIKEENTLLRRYWNDGLRFLVLLWRDVLPQLIRKKMPDDGNISLTLSGDCLLIKGALTVNTVGVFVTELLHCLTSPELRAIDLSSCKCLDARGIGALMMLRKHRPDLKILNAFEGVERIFRENNASYLLEKNRLRMA